MTRFRKNLKTQGLPTPRALERAATALIQQPSTGQHITRFVYGVDGPMPADLLAKVKAHREAGKFQLAKKSA